MRRWLTSGAKAVQERAISKILVANRGEIACRVMRTARRLGIRTVAVYSSADEDALHVRMADEAYCVGPAPSGESYLSIARVMEAVRASGAEAVHPGYGFLSENAEFCAALARAGVEFIGPGAESMRLMGDKIASKRIAREAGVSTIPGFDGAVGDVEEAVGRARALGYPVMVKASAGGGGKGMRVAWGDAELREGFLLAGQESRASFGDDRLLLEKFIAQPRHVEIQLLGDKHGSIVYLPERECSVQRRNQKVIEEAPSTAVTEALWRRMGAQAVQLARRVGYYSAGTVEFLLDAQGRFYFLEMNTRLQVEHAITELVTGLDLVEQMIHVAAGRRLAFGQGDVRVRGWAVEGRVYAEDPRRFLPSAGRLVRYVEPVAPPGASGAVRCDTGMVEGSVVSVHYDPLICKLSTHGATRAEALDRMARALDAYVITGVTHNVPLLREVIGTPRFRAGALSTAFLAEQFPGGFTGHRLSAGEGVWLAALAATVQRVLLARRYGGRPAAGLAEWYVRVDAGGDGGVSGDDGVSEAGGVSGDGGVSGHVSGHGDGQRDKHGEGQRDKHGDGQRDKHDDGQRDGFVRVNAHPDTGTLCVAGTKVTVKTEWDGESVLMTAVVDGQTCIVQVLKRTGLGFDLQFLGTVYAVQVLSAAEHALWRFMPARQGARVPANLLLAPMPGQIVSVAVAAGDQVPAGADLLVMEAMKMQNVLKAPRAATVRAVHVQPGQGVRAEQVLLEFAAE